MCVCLLLEVNKQKNIQQATNLYTHHTTPKSWTQSCLTAIHSGLIWFEPEQWSYGFMSFPPHFQRESVSQCWWVSLSVLRPALLLVVMTPPPTPLRISILPFSRQGSLMQNWATVQFYLISSTLKIISLHICGWLPLGQHSVSSSVLFRMIAVLESKSKVDNNYWEKDLNTSICFVIQFPFSVELDIFKQIDNGFWSGPAEHIQCSLDILYWEQLAD